MAARPNNAGNCATHLSGCPGAWHFFTPPLNPLLIFSPQVYAYRRGGKHPAQPHRLRRTFELIEAYHVMAGQALPVLAPREASCPELAVFHTHAYIDAVRRLSEGAYENVIPDDILPQAFGLRTGGNPIFPGMYQAGAVRVGGGLQAVEALLNGTSDAVFHPAGGGHHGQPARTSGFCIFNDVVIAIQALLARGLRVAYLDVDAHHGDGVQQAFYTDPRVLTISLHETGETLFPGTGDVDELGEGAGLGYSINVPFLRETDDETYWNAFGEIVPMALERFVPDVLVTEFGADAHFSDPLAHLKLTTRTYEAVAQTCREMSPGKWLCVGGGGYREATVPRVWALVWAQMNATVYDDTLPPDYQMRYAEDGDRLRDAGVVALDPELQARAAEHAVQVVQFLRQEIALLRP